MYLIQSIHLLKQFPVFAKIVEDGKLFELELSHNLLNGWQIVGEKEGPFLQLCYL